MRIAFLPDSFHEVNGVAHTARNYTSYAQRHNVPFLCIRAGQQQPALQQHGSVLSLELPRSRLSVPIEKDLSFDPLFARHARAVGYVLKQFRPDVIHITGPSELGILGAFFARRHGIPLAASWHTNVHEYAGRRLQALSRFLPALPRAAEAASLSLTARFYRMARVLFAPNEELCELLERRTGRPAHRMPRGVDTDLFNPARRTRPQDDGTFLLGYVGRLSVEKNVALLPTIQLDLRARGIANTRFVIVGHGSEEAALRSALPDAIFPGVLKGEALAQAYADMDLFVFPSETDTFGNVVLEALASGVPALVTRGGGPKFIVLDNRTGLIRAPTEFTESIAGLLLSDQLRNMSSAARQNALTWSWDAVFDGVRQVYEQTF
ncbi:glycosyltransferase [Terriglobus aquaticus]|uniref:Glycosyltransferase n=1 Tax=Terriglobus aquaticus TaxID=940139 RepID=A0ABW9KMP9_9BACT|nr:glycosyltransferase [Terriglobus aquaticus]